MAGTKHETGDVWVLGILSCCSEVGDVPASDRVLLGVRGAASAHTAAPLFAGRTLSHLTPLVRMRFSTKRPSVKAHG